MTADPQAPVHAPVNQFTTRNGELVVGGISLPMLAETAGQTPFYAYDRQVIAQRVRTLRGTLPPTIQIHYAMKANPLPALVDYLVSLVDGIDVASEGELIVALKGGAAPTDISFAGPAKSARELHNAVAAGILINIESLREIPLLARASEDTGQPARVAIRLNPDFELKSSGMKMGGGAKPFGIDAEAAPQALRAIGEAGLAFEGFHVFAGSQNLNANAIAEAQRQSYELIRRLAGDAPAPTRTLNLGGGFGIPYFPGEQPLDLAPIAANLAQLTEQARADLPGASLRLELGRYLVGEAGVYVTRIVDRKISRGQTFLITDGGMHHHLAASGNFGQVIRKNYPVAIGTKMATDRKETVTIVGPLCTPLDILADKVELPIADVGDLVVVFQSGAYGLTASPQAFLGHPLCTEVLI